MLLAVIGLLGCKSSSKAEPEDCEKLYWHAFELDLRDEEGDSFDAAFFDEIKQAYADRKAGKSSENKTIEELTVEVEKAIETNTAACRKDFTKKDIACALAATTIQELREKCEIAWE